MIALKLLIARALAAATPAASGSAVASQSEIPSESACDDQPLDRRVADPPPRSVGDPHQRHGVGRVVQHGEIGDGILDLGSLVEPRPTDHLVRDTLPDEHVLEHARLRVRAVEHRDLGSGVARLDPSCDLRRDEARLGVLVLHLDDLDGIARPELRPQVLRLAVAVVVDHRVRGLEDRVRRAVVLLERDDAGAAEVALEVEDVADVGAAERVDRLIGVPDGEHVPVLRGEKLEQAVLGVVRVLVLVDEDVAERRLPALEGLGEPLEHLDREHQHVVEVDRVRGEEPLLVALVHLGDGLIPERRDPRGVVLRRDQLVLRVRDLGVDPARREPLRVLPELLEARLHDAHLVGLVVDRERRAVAEPLRLAAQDPPAGRVEREDPDRARGAAEHPLEPLPHLGRRLVRERDREDLVRLHAVRADQVGDAMGEDARLPRAGAGDDEERPLDVEHSLALGRIQVGEELVVRSDGHASMLAAASGSPAGRVRRGHVSVPGTTARVCATAGSVRPCSGPGRSTTSRAPRRCASGRGRTRSSPPRACATRSRTSRTGPSS